MRGGASRAVRSGQRYPAVGSGWIRRVGLVRLLLVGYYLLYVAWFVLSGATGPTRTFVSDAAYLPLGAAGLVLAARAAWRAPHRRDRLVWALIAFALVCRLQGDGSWWWLEAVDHRSPFPSVADIGYNGFYPVLIVAVALTPVRRQSRLASAANTLDVLAMVGAVFMVIWYLVLGAAVQVGAHSLEQVLNICYPMWDLLLLLAAGRVVLRGSDPRWTTPARWLIAGACLFVTADVGFGYLSNAGGFTGGGWLDLPWIGALTCFTLAAATRSPTIRPFTVSAGDRYTHLLPIVAIAASYAVVVKVGLNLPFYPAGGVVLADLVITVVVVARQVLAVTAHRDLAVRYRHVAVTDALTGLGSRGHFLAESEQLLARHFGRCALVMVDVDHFKQINDSRGHLAGDAALKMIADHLLHATRGGDLLARFGGDEFVLLLVDLDRTQAADAVTRMVTPSPAMTRHGGLSLSIGWSINGPDVAALLGRADTALYAAKTAGRNRAVAAHNLTGSAGAAVDAHPGRTSATVDTAHPGELATLSAAISGDQLVLHYQPKVATATGRVTGVEALVRWWHPDHGLRYPDTFLPLVEEAGLMPALTGWVLNEALNQLQAWRAEGLPDLTVAVNLSASSISDRGLPDRIRAALAARGLPGRLLSLEITEQTLIDDRTQAGQVLQELRAHGVQISVDDFGTGYSSLAYLRDLPVDELKLDRAFIAPLADDARAAELVRAIIDMAHALGMVIVAEGVEDHLTQAELTRLGCDLLQGYHLARPMPAMHLAHWLTNRPQAFPPAYPVPTSPTEPARHLNSAAGRATERARPTP